MQLICDFVVYVILYKPDLFPVHGTYSSLPAGVLLQGLDHLLVGKQQNEELRKEKYYKRRRKEEDWSVTVTTNDTVCRLSVMPIAFLYHTGKQN